MGKKYTSAGYNGARTVLSTQILLPLISSLLLKDTGDIIYSPIKAYLVDICRGQNLDASGLLGFEKCLTIYTPKSQT